MKREFRLDISHGWLEFVKVIKDQPNYFPPAFERSVILRSAKEMVNKDEDFSDLKVMNGFDFGSVQNYWKFIF